MKMEEKIEDWKTRMTDIKLEMQGYLRENTVGEPEKTNILSATHGLMTAVGSVGKIIREAGKND